MRVCLGVSLIASAMLIAGCKTSDAEISALKQQIDALKKDSAEIRQNQVVMREWIISHIPVEAELDPTNKNFEWISTTATPVAFNVADVKAKADGSEMILNIGNPSGAQLENLTFKVTYGQRRQPGEDEAKWKARLLSEDVIPTCEIDKLQWNSCSVSLPGVKPDNLGYILINSVNVGAIKLIGE